MVKTSLDPYVYREMYRYIDEGNRLLKKAKNALEDFKVDKEIKYITVNGVKVDKILYCARESSYNFVRAEDLLWKLSRGLAYDSEILNKASRDTHHWDDGNDIVKYYIAHYSEGYRR